VRIQRKNFSEICQSIIHILVGVLICSFTILSSYGWGEYVMIACLFLILLLDVVQQGMVYRFTISRYVCFMGLFLGYVGFSAIIAINPSETITNAITLAEMILMIFTLEQFYMRQENGVQKLLTILKWTSYIIVIYSILFYGIDTLMYMAAVGKRMDNRYANVNIIGMLAAVCVVIQVDEMLREKRFKLASVFCVPAIFLLAVTQSRKALLILVIGVVLVSFMHNQSGNWLKTLLKFVATAIILLLLLQFLVSLDIFSGILERFNDMVLGVLGLTEGDASTSVRSKMVEVGIDQFFRTPLVGVGIGNAHLVAAREIGVDAYLHNNFIELLCGGGLIGFGLYYLMYVSLFVSFFKYRKSKNSTYIVCFTLTFLMLVMDYGRVTYYDKMNYVYLLIFFLETAALKREANQTSDKEREIADDTLKTA